jgi:hypothetical protein
MLLDGDGQSFVEWYYEYLEKIYNKQIPLMKIAQRAKVKLSMDDYKKRSKEKTKAGNEMSRMAHMELAIRDGIAVNLGDVIYYVNNGLKASHGDVQKVNKPKKGWSQEQLDLHFKTNEDRKEKVKFLQKNGWEQSWDDDNWVRSNATNKEANTGIPTERAYQIAISDMVGSVVQLNCYRLNPSELESNPGITGEYNVPRAIVTFNKRIEPLLIVFGEEVRNNLIVTDPKERGLFTKDQCKLINGVPFEPADQDSIEDLLTITDQEMKFWESINGNPNHIYDFAEEGWEKYMNKSETFTN